MGCNGVGRRDVKTLEEVEGEGGGYIRRLKWPDIITCKNTKYTTGRETCIAMLINREEG